MARQKLIRLKDSEIHTLIALLKKDKHLHLRNKLAGYKNQHNKDLEYNESCCAINRANQVKILKRRVKHEKYRI